MGFARRPTHRDASWSTAIDPGGQSTASTTSTNCSGRPKRRQLSGTIGASKPRESSRLIVRYLEPCDGWREKIDALLVIVETLARHPETERGVPLVDVVLGELLRNRVALDKILGPAKSLGHRLANIAYLHEAKLDVRIDMTAPNLVGRLNTILNKFPMRAVRAGLAFQVRLELASRAQIVSVEVVEELRALAELHQTLRSGESYVGGDGVSQLLERRILRTLGPDGSSEFLSEQPAKSDELETLIGVDDKLSETAAKKILTGLIERAFDDEDLAEQLFNGAEDTQRLRTIGRLYEVIERSRLSKEHKQRFCEKTQNIQIGFIDERSFFSNLDRAEPDPASKALYLIDLCAEGAFVPGPILDNAKQAIDGWIASEAFLPNYLNGATDPEEQFSKIAALKQKLRAIGFDNPSL